MGTATFEAWIKTSFKRDCTTLFKVIDRGCSMGWGLDLNASNHFGQIVFKKDAISRYMQHKLGENGCKNAFSGSPASIFDGKWHHIVYVNDTYVDEAGLEWREQPLYIDSELHPPGLTNVTALDTFIPFVEPVYLGAGNNRGKAERFSGAGSMRSVFITALSLMLKFVKILKSDLLWTPCRNCRRSGVR